jgi:CPA2 family monovalent cation:H+ antiporter-2
VAALAIVVVATAIFGYIAQRIGLVAIVGYIVAGIVIGPYALGFIVDDFELVEAMGEIGVIFLMFFIGLELGGDLLKKLGALLFGGGAIQVTLTIALVAAIAAIFGVDVKTGIYTGCLVALSSTAVVLKLLSARNETASPSGEVSVAFLIFQDIAVVILVLLVPMLGDAGGSLGAIVLALVKALLLIVVVLLLIVVVLVVSKWVIPPILDAVWKNSDEEAFLLIVLALAAGIAYGVTLVGLTASLGAFVAGLVISGGEHRERATGIILPFQALFAAIFFASIGMRLDPGALLETWPLVLLFSVVVVIIKFIGVGTAAAVFKRPLPVVVSSGLVLAQIGEFSFILENIGRQSGLSPLALDETGSQVFIAVTVLLIALTPLLFKFGNVMQKRLEGQQTAKSVS